MTDAWFLGHFGKVGSVLLFLAWAVVLGLGAYFIGRSIDRSYKQ